MLKIMDLINNSLNGTIPAEIGGMPSLKCLLFHNNKFEGVASPPNGNIEMPYELQYDGSHVSRATAEYGCLNRKFGHWFKSEEGSSSENAEDCCENLTSSIEPQIKSLVNTVRHRLAEESTNLAVAPASGASAEEPIIALSSTRSSDSFPAIPKEKINSSLAPAEPPQVSHHAVAKPENTEKADGHSGDKWKYIVGVLVAIFVVLVATVIFFVCHTRAVKNIRPWKSGLSGQLQKAFVTVVHQESQVLHQGRTRRRPL